MNKRALSAVMGCLGCCLSLPALQAQMPGQMPFGGTSLDRTFLPIQPLTLDGEQRFSFASLSWQTPVDFLPSFTPKEQRSVASSRISDSKDSFDNVVELRARDRIYVGGEVGFVYGRSTGKYGGEFESGYVIGEIGNEHFTLRVGTSYGRSSGYGAGWRR